MLDRLLKNVLEQPGVDGACIIDKKGVIIANELPAYFLDDFLDDLSRRITSLFEAVDESYMACDDYLLKYPQKHIRIRRNKQIYLLVVAEPSVNQVSLRMVSNIVLKHVTPRVLSEQRRDAEASKLKQSEEEPAAVEEPPVFKSISSEAPAPSSEKETPPEPKRGDRVARPKRTRFFRGSKY